MKAPKIRAPRCISCEFLRTYNIGYVETRYCACFKKRKPKRFRKADPKYKVPSWCPRLINPPVLRLYRLDSTFSLPEDLPDAKRLDFDNLSVNESHYRLEREEPSILTARKFYQAVKKERSIEKFVRHIEFGDIIEIDDGIRPYYFYCCDYATVVQVLLFHKDRVGALRKAVLGESET